LSKHIYSKDKSDVEYVERVEKHQMEMEMLYFSISVCLEMMLMWIEGMHKYIEFHEIKYP